MTVESRSIICLLNAACAVWQSGVGITFSPVLIQPATVLPQFIA
jgi:hypothetical protein